LATMYDRAANPEPAKKPEEVVPTQKGDEESQPSPLHAEPPPQTPPSEPKP